MAITLSQCDAVILAGGHSRRMGTCKALLPWNGKPLIVHISDQLAPFENVRISANDPQIAAAAGLPCIKDIYSDVGPLGGLHAALSSSQKEFTLCVPCDLPHFRWELASALMNRFPEDSEAIVCRDSTGRVHPLCGIFSKNTLTALTRLLETRSFCVMAFLDRISYTVLDTSGHFPDSLFYNLNTMHDYQMLNSTN